ncbi:DUF1542 domain-containing protein [Gemella haemolysans]|uniref:DUF1542 domain-containing protein n=1 Tax=Gemella haemolysans TaxID=1379 RepID=UPI003AF45629
MDNATTNAEVDQAKDNGTTEVKAVNPQPVAKTEAKKAIDDALKAKNDEIGARTDLTDEEKLRLKKKLKPKQMQQNKQLIKRQQMLTLKMQKLLG